MKDDEVALGLAHWMNGDGWRSQTEILKLITSHINRYPLIQIQDVYKLLYQGTMGIDHFFPSSQVFEERLFNEMGTVQADETLPLWEPIRPDGKVVRLNLAAYKAKTNDIAALATLGFWTADLFKGNREDLKTAWNTFQRLCHTHRIQKFPPDELDQFHRQIEKNKYLPVHHSEVYRQAYKPAYRLISREFLGAVSESLETKPLHQKSQERS